EAEDKARREQIERRNKLDNLCYTLEKTVNENKEKLPAADVATFDSLIKEGREAVEKQDDAKITELLERLEKEAHRVASVMYQGAGGPGAPGGPGAGADGGAAGADGGANGAAGGGGETGKKKEGGVI